MTYMPLRTVTIDLGNLRGQIFSRTEFAPSALSLTHKYVSVWVSAGRTLSFMNEKPLSVVSVRVAYYTGQP